VEFADGAQCGHPAERCGGERGRVFCGKLHFKGVWDAK
jgi:hypothetical protein